MIAGAGHPRADEPRNRSGDGAAAQRPAAARRPVAPGREGDRRRRLLGAELPRRRESPCDSGDGSCGPGRVREGCGAGAGGERGVRERIPRTRHSLLACSTAIVIAEVLRLGFLTGGLEIKITPTRK